MFTYGKNMYIWQRKSLMQWVIICKLFFLEFFFTFLVFCGKHTTGKVTNECNDANVNMVVNFAITISKKFEISVLANTYMKKSETNV